MRIRTCVHAHRVINLKVNKLVYHTRVIEVT